MLRSSSVWLPKFVRAVHLNKEKGVLKKLERSKLKATMRSELVPHDSSCFHAVTLLTDTSGGWLRGESGATVS